MPALSWVRTLATATTPGPAWPRFPGSSVLPLAADLSQMLRTFCAGVVAGVSLSWLYPRLLRQLSFVTRLVRVRVSSRAALSFSIERCLSRVARAKRPALLRELLPLLKLDGMVPMAGGTPHPSTFPVRAYQLELADGGVVRIDEPQLVAKAKQDRAGEAARCS